MKKIFLLLAVVIFASCNSDDDNVRLDTPDAITTILPEGKWKISLYVDDNQDKTGNFSSFVFEFKADSTVTATNDILSEVGTWAYDKDPSDPELDIRFDETSVLDEISEDWDIVSVNPNKIELKDIDSDGDEDYLTFVKI